MTINRCKLSDNVTHISKNYTQPGSTISAIVQRKVTLEDVTKQKLNVMPGYTFKWNYFGMEVKPWAAYSNYSKNPEGRIFVRNLQNCIKTFEA